MKNDSGSEKVNTTRQWSRERNIHEGRNILVYARNEDLFMSLFNCVGLFDK